MRPPHSATRKNRYCNSTPAPPHTGPASFRRRRRRFKQSISRAPSSDPKRLANQEDAYYNLGNALYRTGQKTEQTNPQETLQKWTEAVKAYETALQLRADDADSKYNRDLVKRKIDALRQEAAESAASGPVRRTRDRASSNRRRPERRRLKGRSAPAKRRSICRPPTARSTCPRGRRSAQQEPARRQPGSARGRRCARLQTTQHLPGQMSREEARELLDSAKGDERHPLAVPLARRE